MRAVLLPAIALLGACDGSTEPAPPAAPPPLGSDFQVVASAPSPGAVGVARAATMTLTFSAPVNPATVNETTVGLWRGSAPVPVSVITDEMIARLIPRDLLEFSSRYVVTASRAVRDTAGRAMIREFRLDFTTKVNRSP
jgi:hypothetical protein